MIMHSPESSCRIVNWSIELDEFDITYKPRLVIKAQALADFIIECTIPSNEVGGQPVNMEIKGNTEKEKEY